MRILVTGASSFVGSWFCTHAAAAGHTVLGLWNTTPLLIDGIIPVTSDLRSFEPAAIDVVVHLACKVMGPDAPAQNRALMDAVLAWKLPTVYASSTVVQWPTPTAYGRARQEDESRLAAAGLPYLIVRPCAPYGPRHPTHTPRHVESFHRLAQIARASPVVPVVGSPDTLRQPLHVADFSTSIVGLLERGVWNASFDAGGPAPMRLRDIIDALAGRPRRTVSLPTNLAARVGGAVGAFEPELLRAFAQDDVVDPAPLAAASGVTPRAFDPAGV